MTTDPDALTHPLPFFHHTTSGRVFYVAAGACPLVFSISLRKVVGHAPVVDLVATGPEVRQATHPFGHATTVASLAADEARRALAEALALDAGPLDATLCRWANFCDDVADRLHNGEELADALDDTWASGDERDVALDDEPANSPCTRSAS